MITVCNLCKYSSALIAGAAGGESWAAFCSSFGLPSEAATFTALGMPAVKTANGALSLILRPR